MADKSLEVKITADVTSLQAKAAIAKAELTTLNTSVKSLAAEFVGASDEMKSSLAPQLDAAAQKAAAAKAEVVSLNAEMKALSAPKVEETAGFFGSLSAGAKEAGESFEALTAKMTMLNGVVQKFSELVLVGFGVDFIKEQVNKVAELGESYAQLSEKTGATTRELAGLRLAATQTNTDFDQVGNALRSLGVKMQDAIVHPSSEAAQAFREAGIQITDTATGQMLPVVDVFDQISKKMDTFQDGTAKTALAGDLLGAKFGSSLIPMMNQVGTGFETLQDQAQSYGLVLSGEQIEAAEQFIQKEKDVQAIMDGVRVEIIGGLLPAFTQIESAFVAAAQDGGAVTEMATTLGTAFKGVIEVATGVGTGIVEVTDILFTFGKEIGDVIRLVEAFNEATQLNFSAAADSVRAATSDMVSSIDGLGTALAQQEKLFDDVHNSLWNPPAATDPSTNSRIAHQGNNEPQPVDVETPQLTPAASGGGGAADAAKKDQEEQTQIAQDNSEARKQIAQSEYEAQVSDWESEVAQGKLTKSQEIQNEIDAQNQIDQANLAEAQKEAESDAAGTAAKAKALDDIAVLTADHNAQMAKLNDELVTQQVSDAKAAANAQKAAAEATAQAWQKAFEPISQAFDSSINGILQGTQTVQQAQLKAAQSIALAYIDAAAKKVVSFVGSEAMVLAQGLATQVGLTQAVVAGTAARTAVKTSADAAGRSEDIALGTAQINASAMKAAAGAYAAIAGIPIVGPVLAPVAAATAYAGVMAFDVLSAAGGMAVPAGVNPLTQLHENEMVLPAHIAQPLTSMINNGNSSVSGDTNMNFYQTNHGVGGNAASAMQNAGQAWMAQIFDLSRNGTLRLPGR